MSERDIVKEKLPYDEQSLILVPFYADPHADRYPIAVDNFRRFLVETKAETGLSVVVVDDGSNLTNSALGGNADLLIKLPENRGKAGAVREGLKVLLDETHKEADFIVQYDGDYDQSPRDMLKVRQKLVELSEANSGTPTLVIGDRYAEGLQVTPNPASVEYRRSVLYFFGKVSQGLGFPEEVRDWASGARGYTRAYAERFLQSKRISQGYGIESEQHITASLSGAKVDRVPLTLSRPRDTNTLTYKWLQFFDVPGIYGDELRAHGRGNLLEVTEPLTRGLRHEVDRFDVDLNPIDPDGAVMHFIREEDRYTMRIDPQYLGKVFDLEAEYPFTLKR